VNQARDWSSLASSTLLRTLKAEILGSTSNW